LLVANGLLYFSANDADNGIELWSTDGTPEGTQLFFDIRNGSVGSSPTYFNVFKDGFIVYANRSGLGFELNFINAAGEINLVKDINEGPASASAFNFYQVNDHLYFNATDAIHGKELWTSDGTLEGTIMIEDLEAGDVGSDPELLILVDNGFYFSAFTSARGRELYFFEFETSSVNIIRNVIPFKCFPNPTSDHLNIESPFLVNEIRIHNIAGQNLNVQNVVNKKTFKISLIEFDRGNYLLTLIGNAQISSQVIVIK
jgi:ELWxxDGT repeat protein